MRSKTFARINAHCTFPCPSDAASSQSSPASDRRCWSHRRASLNTVCTVHKPGENAASPCPGHAVPLLPDFLHPLEYIIFNDALMGIWEDGLFLNRVVPLLFVPDGVGVGFEIHRTACVFHPFQNVYYGAVLPRIRIFRPLVWAVDAL